MEGGGWTCSFATSRGTAKESGIELYIGPLFVYGLSRSHGGGWECLGDEKSGRVKDASRVACWSQPGTREIVKLGGIRTVVKLLRLLCAGCSKLLLLHIITYRIKLH